MRPGNRLFTTATPGALSPASPQNPKSSSPQVNQKGAGSGRSLRFCIDSIKSQCESGIERTQWDETTNGRLWRRSGRHGVLSGWHSRPASKASEGLSNASTRPSMRSDALTYTDRATSGWDAQVVHLAWQPSRKHAKIQMKSRYDSKCIITSCITFSICSGWADPSEINAFSIVLDLSISPSRPFREDFNSRFMCSLSSGPFGTLGEQSGWEWNWTSQISAATTTCL